MDSLRRFGSSGNVTRIEDGLNPGQFECYSYDSSNRLTDAFAGNAACGSYAATGSAPYDHDYAYDNLHNLLSFDGPTYTYGSGNRAGAGDAGPHAVVGIGGTIGFSYDDNGNRIGRTDDSVTTGYSYGPENRLESVDLASADDVGFVYDADGRRVSRAAGEDSTTYVGGLVEIDRDASTVTETRTFYAFAGTPVAVRTHETAATTFLFQNHLGSTVAGFDDTADSRIAQYYYPYGAERAAVGTLPVDQRYTGQTSDATGADSGDTGLVYYNARYYDPDIGAFAAADTIVPTTGLSVGLNRYAYVSGNPVRFTDPSGLTQWEERYPSAASAVFRLIRLRSLVAAASFPSCSADQPAMFDNSPTLGDAVVTSESQIPGAYQAMVERLTTTTAKGMIRYKPLTPNSMAHTARNSLLGATGPLATARAGRFVSAANPFMLGVTTGLEAFDNWNQYDNLEGTERVVATGGKTAFSVGGGALTSAVVTSAFCGPGAPLCLVGWGTVSFLFGSGAGETLWNATLGKLFD